MELIDRNALIKQIERTYCNPCTDRKCLYGGCHLELALDAIEDAPEVDAEPVKHGHWAEIRNAYGELEGYLCECGREVKSKDNYCPNCGAKMDEVEA